MDKNVYLVKGAIKAGHLPWLYTHNPDTIPLGEYIAALDFKTWSRHIMAINCYFSRNDTGEKIVVTVYCNYRTGKFVLVNSSVDFASCSTGVLYKINVARNSKGNIILMAAKPSGTLASKNDSICK